LNTWRKFTKQYFQDPDNNSRAIEQIAEKALAETILLVYAARSEKNNAVVVKQYLENLYP